MQEREKRRIVIASILKPTDDTRMSEKIGATLYRSGLYEVTVMGYSSSGKSMDGLKVLPIGAFPRLSYARWWARWQVLHLSLAIRPEVFIFSTYELLFPAIFLKVILGTRIIYDVRENYYRNILHSEGLPRWLRWPLAVVVRFLEKITAPAIDYFFLAEKGYEKEFRFHRGGWIVLENKATPVQVRSAKKEGNPFRLLFSGTLSESTGVFRAIKLAEALHRDNKDITLTIAGYASTPDLRDRIRREAFGHSFIQLIGIDALVPHSKILELIQASHAGIISYERVPHMENCIPTKLFEYLQASLPILTEPHWPWVARFEYGQPFLPVDFEKPDAKSILNTLAHSPFYTSPLPDVEWSSEEPKLLAAIKSLV